MFINEIRKNGLLLLNINKKGQKPFLHTSGWRCNECW